MVLLSINLKLKQKYLIDNLCFLKNLFILFNYGYFHFLTIAFEVAVLLFYISDSFKKITLKEVLYLIMLTSFQKIALNDIFMQSNFLISYLSEKFLGGRPCTLFAILEGCLYGMSVTTQSL